MTTFKQLEALYWIAELGGFEAAARRLNTTQSAVSKRIAELESAFGIQLFDRSKRNAVLTTRGAEMLEHASDLLSRQEKFVEVFSAPEMHAGRLRIGTTELSAMTWLARWIQAIKHEYPRLNVEVMAGTGQELREGLAGHLCDLVIVPGYAADARFVTHALGELETVWSCRAGLVDRRGADASAPMSMADLARHTLVFQRDQAVVQTIMQDWLAHETGPMPEVLFTNNLQSLIALVLSGAGIAALPSFVIRDLVPRQAMDRLATVRKPPTVPYALMHRTGAESGLMNAAVKAARLCCDFSRAFQGPGGATP